MMCAERRFFDVILVNTNLVIAGLEIKLCEKPSAMEFIEKLFDHRYRKFVFDGALIQGPPGTIRNHQAS
jgi:hypothetical protein